MNCPYLSNGEKVFDEIFDQTEELNTSLRELNDWELINCRQALINRTKIIMGLLDEIAVEVDEQTVELVSQ